MVTLESVLFSPTISLVASHLYHRTTRSSELKPTADPWTWNLNYFKQELSFCTITWFWPEKGSVMLSKACFWLAAVLSNYASHFSESLSWRWSKLSMNFSLISQSAFKNSWENSSSCHFYQFLRCHILSTAVIWGLHCWTSTKKNGFELQPIMQSHLYPYCN